VNTALDFFGNLAELFSWIGLGLGTVFLLLWLIVRSVSGRWIETDAEVVAGSGDIRLRWMSRDGLHERQLNSLEHEQLNRTDRVRLFYSQHTPERIRFDRIGHGESTLRLLTGLLLGLGALATVLSIVLLVIEA